jgi:hypothetical protein
VGFSIAPYQHHIDKKITGAPSRRAAAAAAGHQRPVILLPARRTKLPQSKSNHRCLKIYLEVMRTHSAPSYVSAASVRGRTAQFQKLAACPGTVPLRHVLQALVGEPHFIRAPHQAIAEIRPRVEAERKWIARNPQASRPVGPEQDGWMRVADGAVVGLFFLARMSVDPCAHSAVAPLAVMAVGDFGARRCGPDACLELHYLAPRDQESWERSSRIIAFLRGGLVALGLRFRDSMSSVSEAACLVRAHSALATRLATKRFLRGQYALYAEFSELTDRSDAMFQAPPTIRPFGHDLGSI